MLTEPPRIVPGLGKPVSALGAGCWTIGGPATNRGVPIGWDDVDPDAAYNGLVHAYESGIRLFDTADVYGLGHSERLLGRLLRQVNRDAVVIASKVGYFAGTAHHPYDPVQMRGQFAATLANLGTDHLDLYSLHSSDFGPDDMYLPAAVGVMRDLREQGLIGAIGMRAPHEFATQWAENNHPGSGSTCRWLELFNRIRPDVVSARYNLLSPLYRPEETDIFAFAKAQGVGVLVRQALGQGLLVQHQEPNTLRRYGPMDHRSTDPAFRPENVAALHARLAPLRARHGVDKAIWARLCLRYALHHAPDSPVLVGFRDPAQIHTAATSLGEPLQPDEIAEIHRLIHTTA
jgi:aryl-alcohol dehydrogenase-like predicted oxidoreductase